MYGGKSWSRPKPTPAHGDSAPAARARPTDFRLCVDGLRDQCPTLAIYDWDASSSLRLDVINCLRNFFGKRWLSKMQGNNNITSTVAPSRRKPSRKNTSMPIPTANARRTRAGMSAAQAERPAMATMAIPPVSRSPGSLCIADTGKSPCHTLAHALLLYSSIDHIIDHIIDRISSVCQNSNSWPRTPCRRRWPGGPCSSVPAGNFHRPRAEHGL